MEMQKEKSERRFIFHARKRQTPEGRMLGGLVIITAGVLWLLKKSGVYFPDWMFSFPALLITIGIYMGAKRLFRGFGWFIVVCIGLALLAERISPELSITRFLWPTIVILVGVAMMLGSRKKKWREQFEQLAGDGEEVHDDDFIRSTSVFGGAKKNIITKNFKGGEVVCTFGGAEINLSRSDIQETAVLEFVQVFGGAKLIVPANWKIKNEITAILGGVEDNRVNSPEDESKVLVLTGVVVFGGLEIVSY